MKRLIPFLLASSVAGPALAQHSGHHQPAQPRDPHAGHTMPGPSPAPPATDPHAGHRAEQPQPAQAQPARDPHAGHRMPAQPAADPHAGHHMPVQPQQAPASDPHAGHDMGAAAAQPPPIAPAPAEARSGPAHAADLVFNPAEMARSRAALVREHGGMTAYKLLIDQLEVTIGDGREGYAWDAQFWYGGDIDKFWLKTEGEGAFGEELEGSEVQALWSRAIDPWFDVQAGIRQDLQTGPDRTHFVLGVQGLAPYWLEVDGAVFLSTQGDVTARIEAEYDFRLTRALILQPLVEVDFSLQDVPELGLGSGVTTGEIGLRLRYEFFPRSGPAVLAPYVGVEYERAFGRTEDFRLAEGDDADGWRLLVGLRTWF